MRVFKFTRPRYGAMWHSISYRRGWMPILQSGHVYDPLKRPIKSIRNDAQQQIKRRQKRRRAMLDQLRIRMFFRTYNVRHPNSKKWRA